MDQSAKPMPLWAVRAVAGLRGVAKAGLDVLLPPQCLGCRALVDEPGRLCAACWADTSFIVPPFCAVCGVPFPGAALPGGDEKLEATCGACLARPPVFSCARSAFLFEGVGRDLVRQLKFADRLEGADALARFMVRAGADALADADYLVPVPLHYLRLVGRRYNQSLVLARAIARLNGKPVLPAGLKRVRRTRTQVGLDARQRKDNVRGAFAVPKRAAARIAGARIALIDDVFTTGATVSACAAALKRAGAGDVIVITAARAGGTV